MKVKTKYYYFYRHQFLVKAIMRSCGLSENQTRCLAGHLAAVERHHGINYAINTLKERARALTNPGSDPYRRRRGYWVGPFRPIHIMAQRGRRYLAKALNALKVHGNFYAPPATLSDFRRVRDELASITEKRVYDRLEIYELQRAFFSLAIQIQHHYDTTYPMSGKRAPMGFGSLREYEALPIDHIQSMDYFPTLVLNHYNYFERLVGNAIGSRRHYDSLQKLRAVDFECCFPARKDVAGTVAILNKDGSLKQRVIANCNRILQLACSPVHNATMALLEKHPSSWSHDQERGKQWIAQQLKDGWALSSIDLKQASDRIPLYPQVKLLKELIPSLDEPLNVFYSVSRMAFSTPFSGVYIRWRCGSPMGVKGSWGLFTVFLCSIFERIGAAGAYAIVGDDIVIRSEFTDPVLHWFEGYNIPISEPKSLFNHNRFAEFCGALIDSEGPLSTDKGKGLNLKESPTDLLRRFGKRALRYYPIGKPSRYFIRKLVQFHDLESSGLLKATLDMQTQSLPPANDGGLSLSQIARVLQPNCLTGKLELPLIVGIEPEERYEYRLRRNLLSVACINMLREKGHVVDAWKFCLNRPKPDYLRETDTKYDFQDHTIRVYEDTRVVDPETNLCMKVFSFDELLSAQNVTTTEVNPDESRDVQQRSLSRPPITEVSGLINRVRQFTGGAVRLALNGSRKTYQFLSRLIRYKP